MSRVSSETEARGAAQCDGSSSCRRTCPLRWGCKGSSLELGTSSYLCRKNLTDSVRRPPNHVWFCQKCVYNTGTASFVLEEALPSDSERRWLKNRPATLWQFLAGRTRHRETCPWAVQIIRRTTWGIAEQNSV
jgi:ribosomal protein L37AE/L43A